MSKKIIGSVEPKCIYCAHGKPTPDGENILCVYCGVPDKNNSCKKFKYDPLKREPKSPRGSVLSAKKISGFKGENK